jgi:hypothetical protein
MYAINSIIIKTKDNGWKNCHVLIAGDSHTEKAINPIFFFSAINISQDAEPYYITYWKLLKYLSIHATDTIFVGFSYHNLSSFQDKKLSDKVWSEEMLEEFTQLKILTGLKA